MTETVSLFALATNSALPLSVHRCRVQADRDRSDRRRGIRGIDDADFSGRRGTEIGVGGHRSPVGVHRRIAGLRLPAAFVAHIERVADELELARGDADVPGVLDRTCGGVHCDHGVLSVERGVQRGPVGRVGDLAHQRGVGRRDLVVTRKVGARRRDREAGWGPQVSLVVDREPGHGVLLREPEEFPIRRIRRTLLAHRAVRQALADPGRGADRPDQLVGLQVEDLQGHGLVGARRCEELPVWTDRRTHDLAELGKQTVTQRLDDLVVGDLDAVGVLGADLVIAKRHCRRVGRPRAGKDDNCDAERDDPRLRPAENRQAGSRNLSASPRHLRTLIGVSRLRGPTH